VHYTNDFSSFPPFSLPSRIRERE